MKYMGSLMPLNFISFTATPQDNKAMLKWQTAEEVNTAYFNIQRSIDGNDFVTIGKVNARGNGNGNYVYADPLSSLKGNVVYYRLQSFDKDGRSQYSKVKGIKLTRPVYSISPNPARSFITISGNDAVSVTITDETGRQVLSGKSHRIDISRLSKGIYFMHIHGVNGLEQTEKIAVD
jgi:hypothetical protein